MFIIGMIVAGFTIDRDFEVTRERQVVDPPRPGLHSSVLRALRHSNCRELPNRQMLVSKLFINPGRR